MICEREEIPTKQTTGEFVMKPYGQITLKLIY